MNAGGEWLLYARALLALTFVVGLIFLCAAIAKKSGIDRRLSGTKTATRRLGVVETLYLDPRHRLVIVRRDAKEHLLLISATGELVVESFEKGNADV